MATSKKVPCLGYTENTNINYFFALELKKLNKSLGVTKFKDLVFSQFGDNCAFPDLPFAWSLKVIGLINLAK